MVFKRDRENIRSAARSARSNDGFVFAVCARAPPYPPADSFYLVIYSPLSYLRGVGKLSEAPRAAHDRMTVLFLQFACGHRRIHQLIFFTWSSRLSYGTQEGSGKYPKRAAHDRMTVLFLLFGCGHRRIHQLIFFTWSPVLSHGIQEGSGKYSKRRAQRTIE